MGHILDANEIAEEILEHGFATATIDDEMTAKVQEIFELGEVFFAKSLSEKSQYSVPQCLEGFLPFGSEYSDRPDRPDLNEAFLTWVRNGAIQHDLLEKNDLRNSMHRLFHDYIPAANSVLEALRKRLNPQGQILDASEQSYLQINYYTPPRWDRDYLQERHEDGHLLNFVKSTAPGLEIEVLGKFQSVSLARNEVFLMPGSVLSAITGGLIPPLFHRARNLRVPAVRQSLMFFINAPIRQLTPWVRNECNRHIDILDFSLRNSAAFGLPALDATDPELLKLRKK